MKKIIFFVSLLIIVSIGCENDEIIIQPVPFSINVMATANPEGGMLECQMPEGDPVPLPKVSFTSGTATFLGTLDATKSTQEILNCNFNMSTMALEGDIKVILTGEDGDELHFTGQAQYFMTGVGTGYLEVTNGTGKFEGAYGWIRTNGTTDPITGIATTTGEGMISPPR